MKTKSIFIIVLFLIFILFAFFNHKSKKLPEYKVLDIIRPDLFYVDLNNNDKIDDNELIKLNGIYVFSNESNDFVSKNAHNLHINKFDYLKLGFIAQDWALNNLKGKNVSVKTIIKDKSKKYSYAEIIFQGSDLSEFYLKNGLGFAKENSNYAIYQNNIQIKNNIKEISNIDFVVLNLTTKIYHKINCKFADLIYKARLIPLKNAKNYIPCKNCSINYDFHDLEIPNKENTSFLYKDFGKIELYFTNPLIYKKPDNTCSNEVCKRLVKEINSSKHSIDIALYGIGEIKEVYNALKNAKQRGIKIRAVVDYSKKMDELYPKTRQFINDFNAVTDKNEIIMHNKFFIFDDNKVLTGSANISPSGICGYSANIIAIIKSEKIAKRYKNEFEQMYSFNFSNSKTKFKIVEDEYMSVYFSPKDDIKNMILSKINSSNEEICISAFYLTNKDIINALISARKRGIKIFVILDAVSANNFKDRVKILRQSGIALIVENWGGKDHEKTILFDKKSLITGSLNFSAAGLNKNDENIILIENIEIAKFYRKYFFYLFNSIDKKFLKFIPRAEGTESLNSCTDGVDNNFDGKIDKDDKGCQ